MGRCNRHSAVNYVPKPPATFADLMHKDAFTAVDEEQSGNSLTLWEILQGFCGL